MVHPYIFHIFLLVKILRHEYMRSSEYLCGRNILATKKNCLFSLGSVVERGVRTCTMVDVTELQATLTTSVYLPNVVGQSWTFFYRLKSKFENSRINIYIQFHIYLHISCLHNGGSSLFSIWKLCTFGPVAMAFYMSYMSYFIKSTTV